MAAKRDYGSFGKAVQLLLPGLISELGYTPLSNGFFGRLREGWREGFDLQQSHHGSGEFCINMGVSVPALSGVKCTRR